MSEQDWAQEPWKYQRNLLQVRDANDYAVFDIEAWYSSHANAERAIACVNACAGIPTECLKYHQEPLSDFTLGEDSNGKHYCYFGPFDSQVDAIGFGLVAAFAQTLREDTDE